MKNPTQITNRCPIRTTLELLGGKWRLLLLYQVSQQEKGIRYGALKRAIPDISEKMLAQELRTLTDSGLVARKNYGEVPPRVEYFLTPQGEKALPLIEQMYQFGVAYMQDMH